MSKKATAKQIPQEILDLVRKEFNASEFAQKSRGTGKWSFIPLLQKGLAYFLEHHKDQLPNLVVQYPHGPTEDLLRRAFNLKSPPGATKSLRDLLAFYATRLASDWNGVVKNYFDGKYLSLIDADKPEQADAGAPASSQNIENFASQVADLLLEKLS